MLCLLFFVGVFVCLVFVGSRSPACVCVFLLGCRPVMFLIRSVTVLSVFVVVLMCDVMCLICVCCFPFLCCPSIRLIIICCLLRFLMFPLRLFVMIVLVWLN